MSRTANRHHRNPRRRKLVPGIPPWLVCYLPSTVRAQQRTAHTIDVGGRLILSPGAAFSVARPAHHWRIAWVGVTHTDHAILLYWLLTEKRLKSRSPGPQAHAHHYLHQANQWPAEAAISWSSRRRVAAARPPPPQRPGPAARGRAPRRRASAWSGRRSACCQCLPRRCREVRARPAGWWAPLCRAPAYQKKTRSRVGRARGGARAGQREAVRRTSIARSPRSSTPGGSSAELKSSSTYTSSSSSSFSSSPPFSRRAAASTRADSCAKAIFFAVTHRRGRQILVFN